MYAPMIESSYNQLKQFAVTAPGSNTAAVQTAASPALHILSAATLITGILILLSFVITKILRHRVKK
jgi:hypothetical protein